MPRQTLVKTKSLRIEKNIGISGKKNANLDYFSLGTIIRSVFKRNKFNMNAKKLMLSEEKQDLQNYTET